VELGVNYVLIILMPDFGAITLRYVQFYVLKTVSNYRFRKIKHYISAFGEHVIGKEVECALKEAMEGTKACK
jgi:hypothetical protein